MQGKDSKQATRLLLKYYFGELRREWRISVPALVLPGMGNILMFYVPPLVVARALNYIEAGRPISQLPIGDYVLVFAFAWLVGEVLWRLALHLLNRTDARGLHSLYKNALAEILKRDMAFFADNFVGSLTKKTVAFSRNYERFADELSFSIVPQLVTLSFAGIVLWRFSPLLVLALYSMVGLAIVFMLPLIKRRRRLVDVREAASNALSGHISDVISNIATVRSQSFENRELSAHANLTKDYTTKALRSWDYHNLRIDTVVAPFYVAVNSLGLLLALLLIRDGVQNASVIFLSFTYFTQSTSVMWQFNRIYRNFESLISEAAQFTELLLGPIKINDSARPKRLRVTKGQIGFNSVTFSYDDDPTHLFKDFSINIHGAERVGLVGPSGGGKTTITKLILRFNDVEGGAITIDGQNIKDVRQADLRAQIAYVPQEPALFHRSLFENIAYGKRNPAQATLAEVKRAAKLSHAAEFIDKLPNGYETLVGERGIKLSGGQRQRIAIARAILRDAPILILDEATSALDSESERFIQDALLKLMRGRTAVVVAHRLSTIQRLDRIIVIDAGQVVENGSHQQLLKTGGLYAKLWAHQSGGFLNE